MFVGCAAITFLRGEFQSGKDIRDEVVEFECAVNTALATDESVDVPGEARTLERGPLLCGPRLNLHFQVFSLGQSGPRPAPPLLWEAGCQA
jgi:hypothetical protein